MTLHLELWWSLPLLIAFLGFVWSMFRAEFGTFWWAVMLSVAMLIGHAL